MTGRRVDHSPNVEPSTSFRDARRSQGICLEIAHRIRPRIAGVNQCGKVKYKLTLPQGIIQIRLVQNTPLNVPDGGNLGPIRQRSYGLVVKIDYLSPRGDQSPSKVPTQRTSSSCYADPLLRQPVIHFLTISTSRSIQAKSWGESCTSEDRSRWATLPRTRSRSRALRGPVPGRLTHTFPSESTSPALISLIVTTQA